MAAPPHRQTEQTTRCSAPGGSRCWQAACGELRCLGQKKIKVTAAEAGLCLLLHTRCLHKVTHQTKAHLCGVAGHGAGVGGLAPALLVPVVDAVGGGVKQLHPPRGQVGVLQGAHLNDSLHGGCMELSVT